MVSLDFHVKLIDVAGVEALIAGHVDQFFGDFDVVRVDLLHEKSVYLCNLLLVRQRLVIKDLIQGLEILLLLLDAAAALLSRSSLTRAFKQTKLLSNHLLEFLPFLLLLKLVFVNLR